MYRFVTVRQLVPSPRTLALVFIAFAAAALLTGCNRNAEASTGKKKGADSITNQPPRAVKVTLVKQVPMERVVTVIGALAAEEQATLSVKVAGRIESVAIDLGTKVKKGQVVAVVEKKDYELRVKQVEAQLAQARARLGLDIAGTDDTVDVAKTSLVKQAKAMLDEAAKNLDRVKKLTEKGIVAQSELETADANHEVALNRYQDAEEETRNRQAMLLQRRAELEIARQQLADTEIRSPFDGVIQERRANVGEYLVIGNPVATVVQDNPLRLRVEVPERDAPGIKAGLKVRLTTEGRPQVYLGVIKRLSPSISDLNRMLMVEADVPNDGTLRPGTFARGEIVVDEKQPVTAIPDAALVSFAGIEKVVLTANGRAQEKPVSIGRRADGHVEIVNGVKLGDTVVLDPGNLQTGQPVTTSTEAGPSAGTGAGKGKGKK